MEPLPDRDLPRRLVVVGTSGSGKTTVSRALAARLGLVHVELDALYHGAGWTPAPREVVRERVGEAVLGDAWVVDGNYASMVRDLVFARAQLVVWLDLPRWQVMEQVVRRTLRRVALRQTLWNGNRETVRTLLSRDSIVTWAWRTHHDHRRTYAAQSASGEFPHLRWLRLESRRDVAAFVDALPSPGGASNDGR